MPTQKTKSSVLAIPTEPLADTGIFANAAHHLSIPYLRLLGSFLFPLSSYITSSTPTSCYRRDPGETSGLAGWLGSSEPLPDFSRRYSTPAAPLKLRPRSAMDGLCTRHVTLCTTGSRSHLR